MIRVAYEYIFTFDLFDGWLISSICIVTCDGLTQHYSDSGALLQSCTGPSIDGPYRMLLLEFENSIVRLGCV